MLGKLDNHMQKGNRMSILPLIYINLKLIKDLNMSPDTIELPEESIEREREREDNT